MSRPSSRTSERAEPARRLVVSFHDLHPGSREVCARFLEKLAALGVARASLLVVPRWHGAPPCTEDAAFTAWLRTLADAGHEICLHGFFHRVDEVQGGPLQRFVGRRYTAGEGEFYQIDEATARDRLGRGLQLLREQAGLPVAGFTPPAWLLSEAGRAALVAAGLHYTTTWRAIDLLQRDHRIHAPTLVWSCRRAWRRAASRVWVRFWAWACADAPILRIAAHPVDLEHPEIEASLWARVRAALEAGRTPATYRDLAPAAAPADAAPAPA